jgi:hypothetical protein
MLVLAGVLVLSLSLAAVGIGKTQRLGTSTEVETSAITGKKTVTVTGVLQSPLARCERQRSVLLYEAGPTGDLKGGAIGHGVSEGGANRGQFTIEGVATKRISATRDFILEAVQRSVKVKGKEYVCKRGVSVSFPGTFN